MVKWLRHRPFTAVTRVRIPYGSPLFIAFCKIKIIWSRGVAVNMPACHAGDRRFDPGRDRHSLGYSQAVRQRILIPSCLGSNPSTPAIFEPLAQLVEHLTFNQRVEGSSPSWLTIFYLDNTKKPMYNRKSRS